MKHFKEAMALYIEEIVENDQPIPTFPQINS
jgi:predicted RNase H-like HicB family nuclease